MDERFDGLVEISEIVDQSSLFDFFDEGKRISAQAVVTRCVMRAWPILWVGLIEKSQISRGCFYAQKAMLISAAFLNNYNEQLLQASSGSKFDVIERMPEPGLKMDVLYTAFAASAATDLATVRTTEIPKVGSNAVRHVHDAFRLSYGDLLDEYLWAAVRRDLDNFELLIKSKILNSYGGMFRTAIWGGVPPHFLEEKYEDVKNALNALNEGWEVWFPIYEGFRDGKPLDWDILEKIALIPNADWREDDPAYTNGIIAGIIGEHQLRNANSAERIERNSETGLFQALPVTTISPKRYENALDKVRDRIAELNEGGLDNSHMALDRDLKRLNKMLDRYAHVPLRMHDEFVRALKRCGQKVEVGELAQDDDVLDYIDDLDNGAIDIRGSDIEVRKTIVSRSGFKARRANREVAKEIDSVVEAAASMSDADLAEELREDWKILENLPEEGADPDMLARGMDEAGEAGFRLGTRTSAIRQTIRKENEDESEDSRVGKVVDAADTAGKLHKGAQALEWGVDWIRYFISMLG